MLVDSTSDFFLHVVAAPSPVGAAFFKIFNSKINETSIPNRHYIGYIYCRSPISGNHLPRTPWRFPHHRTKKILHAQNSAKI